MRLAHRVKAIRTTAAIVHGYPQNGKAMCITIETPDGPREGAAPADGIRDENRLVKALLITLAAERLVGNNCVTLRIDLTDFRAAELIAIAKSLAAQPRPRSALH
jgi:hypothetical protein